METPREFTLKFDRRRFHWDVLIQPATKTEDGYETRVIEHSAYAEIRNKLAAKGAEIAELLNKNKKLQAYEDLPLGTVNEILHYKELLPAINQMGGWANFRHWVARHAVEYFDTCANLQRENDKLKAELKSLNNPSDGRCMEIHGLRERRDELLRDREHLQKCVNEHWQENEKLKIKYDKLKTKLAEAIIVFQKYDKALSKMLEMSDTEKLIFAPSGIDEFRKPAREFLNKNKEDK